MITLRSTPARQLWSALIAVFLGAAVAGCGSTAPVADAGAVDAGPLALHTYPCVDDPPASPLYPDGGGHPCDAVSDCPGPFSELIVQCSAGCTGGRQHAVCNPHHLCTLTYCDPVEP